MSKWNFIIALFSLLTALSSPALAGSNYKKEVLDDDEITHLIKMVEDPAYARKKLESKIKNIWRKERNRVPKEKREAYKEKVTMFAIENEIKRSLVVLRYMHDKDYYAGKDWEKAKERVFGFYAAQIENPELKPWFREQAAQGLVRFHENRARAKSLLIKNYKENKITAKSLMGMAERGDKELVPVLLDYFPKTVRKEEPLRAIVQIGDTSPETIDALKKLDDAMLGAYTIYRLNGDVKYLNHVIEYEFHKAMEAGKESGYYKLGKMTTISMFWMGEQGKEYIPFLASMATSLNGWCSAPPANVAKSGNASQRQYLGAMKIREVQECREIATALMWRLDPAKRAGVEKFYGTYGFSHPATSEMFFLSGDEAKSMVPVLERYYATGAPFVITQGQQKTYGHNLGMKKSLAITLQALTGKHYKEAPPLTPNWKQEYFEDLRKKNWHLYWQPF